MIRASGRVLRGCGRVLHFAMVVSTGMLVAASLLLVVLAFRLSRGPIDINWASALHGDNFIINGGSVGGASIGISFDGIVLAWEGFHNGVGLPLDLRLANIAITTGDGRRLLTAHQAYVSLSLSALVRLQLVLRDLELDGGRLTVVLGPNGTFDLNPDAQAAGAAADPRKALAEFAHGGGPVDQLRHIRLRDFALTLRDAPIGLTWQVANAELDLRRDAYGTLVGEAELPSTFAGQQTALSLRLSLPNDGAGRIEASVGALSPAAIAKAVPALSVLAPLDAPVSLQASLQVDPGLSLEAAHLRASLGAGRVFVGTGSAPLVGGTIVLSGTTDRIAIDEARFMLPNNKGGGVTTVTVEGTAQRQADRLTAAIALGFDRLDLADLAELWPPGIGGGARPWLVQNVTAGVASHGSVSLVAEAGSDFNNVVLTKVTGDMDGENVALFWLAPIPGIERAQVHLHLIDPDRLSITMASGHQRVSKGGAEMLIQDGQMEVSGLSAHDQIAKIGLHAAGPVASAISLLREKRLRLPAKDLANFKTAAGDTTLTINLQFPLDDKLQADQVQFDVGAHVAQARVPAIVANRDLTDGLFDLDATNDGLNFKGQGTLATIPLSASGFMDFTAGPPAQVLQRVSVSGQPTPEQLAAAGIDVSALLAGGSAPLSVELAERRDGSGTVAVKADLSPAALQVKALAWSKAAGRPGQASATVQMQRDRIVAIPAIAVDSDEFQFRGSATCSDGIVTSMTIDQAKIGRTQLQGTVQLPPHQPIAIAVTGPQLDLSARLQDATKSTPPAATPSTAVSQPWTLNARFDHVLLANGESAAAVSLRAESTGALLSRLDLNGTMAPALPFFLRIDSASGRRRVTAEAADAGAFLRGSGVTKEVRSGRLAVDGSYDDSLPEHPLAGNLRIDNARLVNAPILGKLLQAMTLYGLSDVLRGPGIGITRAQVPFVLDRDQLRINDGRIYSSSLGLTVKGLIDLAANRLTLNGTIVPAYAVNSALGRIPLVGKLFSPETGGGVFAARYTVDGPLADPSVAVNPLSVLAPGFLRNLFDLGGKR